MKSFVTTVPPPILRHLQSVCSAAAVRKRAFISTQHEVCDDSIQKSIDTPSTCLITLALNMHSRPCLLYIRGHRCGPKLHRILVLNRVFILNSPTVMNMKTLIFTSFCTHRITPVHPRTHMHTVNLLNSATVEQNDAVWPRATLNQWSSSDQMKPAAV